MFFKYSFQLPRFSSDNSGAGTPPAAETHADENTPTAETPTPTAENAESTDPVDPVAQELTELKAKLAETHERMLRVAADADNTRKRLEKEKQETRIYCIQEFARDLLPVVDAFDKAITLIEQNPFDPHTDEGKRMAAIVEGVHMTSRTFHDALKKHGIERLPGKDNPFNPAHHNAISKDIAESYTHEVVVEEFVSGYKIGERILRTALVKVGSPQ